MSAIPSWLRLALQATAVMNGLVGIACDEVMLDLSEDIDPANLEAMTGAALAAPGRSSVSPR